MIEGTPNSVLALIAALCLSGWGIVGWICRLIIVGRLNPKVLMDAKDAELNAAKAERDEYRDQTRVLLKEVVEPLTKLIDVTRTKAEQS